MQLAFAKAAQPVLKYPKEFNPKEIDINTEDELYKEWVRQLTT